MRRFSVLLLVIVIVGAGCGGDGADEPDVLVDRLLQAIEDGDNDQWRELTSPDAVSVFPDGTELAVFDAAPWIEDDFDGDGVMSYADEVQFRQAMHGPARQSMQWECETVSESEAKCVVTSTDAFLEAFDGDPMTVEFTYAFEDGRWIRDVGLAVDEAAVAASGERWAAGMAAYQRWVDEAHSDVFDQVFRGVCCEAGMVMTEEAIAIHDELLDEYLDTAG